jgi:rod shape-determining protein MreD
MILRRAWLFGVVTFFVGWVFQAVFLYLTPPTAATPQWLLLAVLALGSMGKVNMAQTLGFFWGLSLDTFGVSLFGSQAWLLAVMGYLAGRLSRQLNADKWVTQEALALAATAFFWFWLYQLDLFFRWPEKPHFPGAGKVILEFLWNAAAAPVVFWLMRKWMEFWVVLEGGNAVLD